MGRAKEIELRVIPASIANPFVKKHHYSGKVVNNSKVHFGAFLDGNLHGVMSYGSSTDKSKIIGLVEGTGWNEFLELNRMAFDDYLPRNSESRCIAQSIRLIRKQAPHIKWIISFADGCQCGDGTIYRASGFILTGIKPNRSIVLFPSGHRIAQITITAEWNSPQMKEECRLLHVEHKYRPVSEYIKLGAKYLSGYQLRYIYFIDKSYRERLTVKELPFDMIDQMNAGMYKGETISLKARREE
jgi:protein mom